MIVLQEAYGVNAHIRDVAERFAREGYVAIAPELYHRTAPGLEGKYNDFPAVREHMQAMTTAGAEADLRAVFEWLNGEAAVANDRIAAVGYCLGGRAAFLANATLPLGGAVSYYGGNIPSLLDRAGSLTAPMLFFWGELDKHIPLKQRSEVMDALKAAGKQYVNVAISFADHGFFCDPRPSCQPEAAQLSWSLTLEFLKQRLR